MITIDIRTFLTRSPGTSESFHFDVDFDLQESDICLTQPVHFDCTLIKLAHEITVHLKNFSTRSRATCTRCLKVFTLDSIISSIQRQFIIDLPKRDILQGEDVFYIPPGASTLDITDMIREEILLHFPSAPVCCIGCKGLCVGCGANLNETSCTCKDKSLERNSPFKHIRLV